MSEPLTLTESDARAVLARAQAELAKLGVTLEEPLEEKVYRALLELPPQLKRACTRQDVAAHLAEQPKRISDALSRLLTDGRAIRPFPGVWVATT